MRRPSFCCDHDKPPNEAACPHQGGGALARVRRFLSISLGRRHHHGATTSSQSSSRHHLHHHHKPPSSTPSEQHCPLSQLVSQASSVLGLPLDQVMLRQGEDHTLGVPVLVHVLCCYMLSHGVDHEVLVTEDWMVDEVRLRLVTASEQGHTFSMKEPDSAAAAAGLLRLFLHDLPHPLLHPQLMQPLLDMCQELDHVTSRETRVATGGRVWTFLSQRLSSHNLNLMSYLSAFLHQLHSSNHTTCPVTSSSLGRVLGRVLIGRSGTRSDMSMSTQIAELFILHYTSVFHNSSEEKHEKLVRPTSLPCELTRRYVMKKPQTKPKTSQPKIRPWCFVHVVSDVSVVSSPDSGAEDSRGEDDDSGAPIPLEEEEDTTTTTDTDDFRSLPVSPIKSSFSDLPLDSSPPLDPPSPLDNMNLNLNDAANPGWERRSPSGAWNHEVPYPGPRNRSNNELSHLDDINAISPYCKTYIPLLSDVLTSPDDLGREDDVSVADEDDQSSQSADSSCVSVSEYWDTGCESASIASSPHEERRWSERSLPLVPQTTRRHRRKTRRKHANKEGGLKFQSSEEEGKLTEEEDYVESTSPQEHTQYHNDNSANNTNKGSGPLSELLAFNEPVTTSDRGSWGLRRDMSHYDSWHRTAHHYNRYEEPTELPGSWYNSHEDQPVVSPRAFHQHPVQSTPLPEEHFSSSGHSAVKILMKNINSIKKKIKKFEEEFEAAFGYRPSHSDKMKHKDIKKYMTELSKARKELKQMKDDVAGIVSAQTVFPLSLLRCQESTTQHSNQLPLQSTQVGDNTAATLRQVEERLREKRSASGRPIDLGDMTSNEIQDEKTALQKALLYYESVHGRPSTREDRDLARPLYDRYRLVKRSVVRSNSRKDNLLELAPILEHEAMDFTLASPQHRSSLQETEISIDVQLLKDDEALSPVSSKSSNFGSEESISSLLTTREEIADPTRPTIPLGDLHALPLSELRERKKEAREDKKRLRRALRDYEEKFERDTGRKVQKEDRGIMEPTYVDYKHAKAKLRLLEALISKHEPCKL